MKSDDAQKVWTDYYQRKKAQRLEEAVAMWERMRLAGVRADTDMVVDFLMFGTSREAVEALASQLSENYQVEVSEDARPGYWVAKATTRPYAITLTDGQLNAWVDFVADVAQSHACVFSTWKMEAPALGQSFLSEEVESASCEAGCGRGRVETGLTCECAEPAPKWASSAPPSHPVVPLSEWSDRASLRKLQRTLKGLTPPPA